ncbi:MAG: hypothetical protein U1E73_07605 [Planctomycetota bacterium]
MARRLRKLAVLFAAVPLAAQWGPVGTTNTPVERSGALMGYDLPNNRMLMFGGNYGNEFWSLQNGAWTQLPNGPSARARANLAVDTLGGTIVLYGGDGGSSRYALDETWQWDGLQWTQLAPASTPGGLARHAMAFDLLRQTTVLFGGRYDSWTPANQSGATWEFANGAWAQAAPAAAPPARVDAAMAFHAALGEVMLFGGVDGQGSGLDDTWTFDGTTWTQRNTTGLRPSARGGARLVQVLGRSLCALFGGQDPASLVIANDTWEHDGSSWRLVNNVYGGIYPARHGFAMAEDLARQRIVAFGGQIANGSLQNDTWEYGAHWQPFGSGCAGTAGVPQLVPGALPQLGAACTAQLTNLPASSGLALIAIGFSRQQWALGNLPMLLTAYGMPGCRLYTSADATRALMPGGGSAQWSWTVPSGAAFVGQPFHLQGLVLDPGVNAAGATVSNAATIVIGW